MLDKFRQQQHLKYFRQDHKVQYVLKVFRFVKMEYPAIRILFHLIPYQIKLQLLNTKRGKRNKNRIDCNGILGFQWTQDYFFTLTQNWKFSNKFINDKPDKDRDDYVRGLPHETLLQRFELKFIYTNLLNKLKLTLFLHHIFIWIKCELKFR